MQAVQARVILCVQQVMQEVSSTIWRLACVAGLLQCRELHDHSQAADRPQVSLKMRDPVVSDGPAAPGIAS